MQMQDKQPQSRPPIKMADTPDYMGLYIADLLRMKAQGKSHGEMLSWLRAHGVEADMGEIAAFWQDYDKKQKKQPRQPETTAGKVVPATSTSPTPGSARNPEPNENADVAPIGTTTETVSNQSELEKKDQHGFIPSACQAEAAAKAEAKSGDGRPYAPELPMLWDCVLDLVALRGVGKTDAEILAYLGTSRRLYTCAKEIANAIDYYEKCQEEIIEDFEHGMERDLDEEHDQLRDLEKEKSDQDGSIASACRAEASAKAETNNENPGGDTEKPNQPAEEKGPPMASGGPTAAAPGRRPHTPADFDISAIMDDYKVVVARQAAKDKATENLAPERDKVTQGMIRTLMIYKRSLERREERMMALKIKTEEHELKKSKAAAASQEQEEAKETAGPSQKKAPKDFDNTAHIQLLRHAAFWDVDAILASGLVDEWIVAVENKSKAMGAQVQGYIPPPLGTGLWSKPAPVPEPGVPSAHAAPAGAAATSSGKALSASDAASHLANVMARINAFMSALAQRAAADPSGITYPMADASSHTSGHQPTTQPSPPREEPAQIVGPTEAQINSQISQQSAKPGPTDAGTTPAINPSG
jgi:hypothetical protein